MTFHEFLSWLDEYWELFGPLPDERPLIVMQKEWILL